MTRIEAIARLRELADRLEAASDAPHDGHGGFGIGLSIFDHYWPADQRMAVIDYWVPAIGATERGLIGEGANVSLRYRTPDQCARVFISDVMYQPPADLLANRDVQVLEIGGAA